jgi:voltage-gated potassium channel
MQHQTLRKRTSQLLRAEQERGTIGYVVNVGLASLIILSILDAAIESIPVVARAAGGALRAFEYIAVGVFSIEYLARLWSCVESPTYRRPVLGRLRFAFTPMALIDLAAIAPFFLPWVTVDLMGLRTFRLLRLARLLKLGRYSESLRLMGRVFSNKRMELLSTALAALFLLVASATLLHAAESEAQPDKFGSIPQSMWWAVVTMTTVGYGDVFPVTTIGKVFGSLVAFLGIGFFALPAGILGSGFLEESARKKAPSSSPTSCPHCGGDLRG